MTKTRLALQSFRDKNRNLFLNTAKIEENKLEDDFNVAQEVYSSLIKQSETLTISEKQTKPVFEVLDPPMVPNGKSGPNRLFYGIGGAFLAFILLSITLIFIYSRKPKKGTHQLINCIISSLVSDLTNPSSLDIKSSASCFLVRCNARIFSSTVFLVMNL